MITSKYLSKKLDMTEVPRIIFSAPKEATSLNMVCIISMNVFKALLCIYVCIHLQRMTLFGMFLNFLIANTYCLPCA